MKVLRFAKVRDVKSPERGTPKSAGIDIFLPNDHEVVEIFPNSDICVPSGLHFDIPEGFALIAFNKSGVSTKKKLGSGACIIDQDYLGQVHIHLFNHSDSVQRFQPGEKMVQLLMIPVEYAALMEIDSKESLYETKESERGAGGFGSTGDGLKK